MSYEANLLNKIQKGGVYRLATNGHFFLVTGFTRIQKGKDADAYEDAVIFHRVEYISIPQSNPAINQPKVGLRTTSVEQQLKRVRLAPDFMDNFFLHEKAESRPSVVSVVSPKGDEVLFNLQVLNGDKVVMTK